MTQLSKGAQIKNDTIRRRKIFEDDGWSIYRWDDHYDYAWSYRFTIWHECGIENPRAVRKRADTHHMCVRCAVSPPDGLVGLYEMLNWNEQGHGG